MKSLAKIKYMKSSQKNVYIVKLDDTENKYNNTYYNTFKINPVDVNSTTYNDSNKEDNKEDPTF